MASENRRAEEGLRLEGQVKDISLQEIFRLLKISGKSGVLRASQGKARGEVTFTDGDVCWAVTSTDGAPLGERLVRAGRLTAAQLAELRDLQRNGRSFSLDVLLKQQGRIPQEVLETYVREQIEDSVANLFGWPEAAFHFLPGEPAAPGSTVVAMDAEGVIMEGTRRVDEWRVILSRLGSLEKVPQLVFRGGDAPITLKPREWEVVSHIDGRRDINTIVAESGIERFRVAKLIHGLVGTGLVTVRDPTLELLGQRTAIALKGPIDLYNVTFLTTACTSEVSNHLRVETLDEEEVQVRIHAGVREDDSGSGLLYCCESRAPSQVVKRMALETSGFVLLVNINSRDSVVVSRHDVALMEQIADKPYVVALYASLIDEKVTEEMVRDLLPLRDRVPVVSCNLRDPEETTAVLDALRALIP